MAIEILNDRPSLERYRCNADALTFFSENQPPEQLMRMDLLMNIRHCPKCGRLCERIK